MANHRDSQFRRAQRRLHRHASRTLPLTLCSLSLVSASVLAACEIQSGDSPGDNTSTSDDTTTTTSGESTTQAGTFTSVLPNGQGVDDDGTGVDETQNDTTATNSDTGDTDGLEISEADIVKIDGDRLYALSPYAGLVVADIADTSQMRVLGKQRAPGNPFEMYVDQDQVFAMYNDYSYWGWIDYDIWTPHSASRLVALDTSNPADIRTRGEFEMPGTISDSRRIGNILYLVTNEDGYCWGCSDVANTTVTSFDVSNLDAITLVDQIQFDNENPSWGTRSVVATPQRIYVGGPSSWKNDGSTGSVIDVVDISSGDGQLSAGASIEVAGGIKSRWQINEHEGVLRVLSQSEESWPLPPPVLETYEIVSTQEFSALGRLELVLPRPEELKSVRFDGSKAYAITFERTDPLFTLDLSTPAAPKQVGELEIPGWVTHMEPRGDRLLALGYEIGAPQGSLHTSLFDVSDLQAPKQLARVNFGGQWGAFAEDQNRLHKAFTIDESQSLLAIPFAGWTSSDDWSCTRGEDGIALVDWRDDTLTARGVAPTPARARRALLHGGELLALSDRSLRAFDITNRDAPALRSEATFSRHVLFVAQSDEHAVTLGMSASGHWQVALSQSLESAALDQVLAAVELDAAGESGCDFWPSDLWTTAQKAHVLVTGYQRDLGTQSSWIVTVDFSNPLAPTQSTLALPFVAASWSNSLLPYSYESQRTSAQVGDALVLLRGEKNSQVADTSESAAFEIIDLGRAGGPVHVASIARPKAAHQGGLTALGQEVWSWHAAIRDADLGVVSYYLEKLDLSDAANPVLLPSVNTPGIALAGDGADGAWALDFQVSAVSLTESSCYNHPLFFRYTQSEGCLLLRTPVHHIAIADSTATIKETLPDIGVEPVAQLLGTQTRLFVVRSRLWNSESAQLVAYGLDDAGKAKQADLDFASPLQRLKADASTLFYLESDRFVGLDTQDINGLVQTVSEPLASPGYGCSDLLFTSQWAACAAQDGGLRLSAWQ